MPSLVNRLRRAASRLWNRLPVDGCGVLPGGPGELRRLRRVVARERWRRVPWWVRPAAVFVARTAWGAVCPLRALAAVRGVPAASAGTLAELVWLGWTRGKEPAAALAHRRVAGAFRVLADGFPDDRQAGRFWMVLADPADRALADDKRRTAERLAALGVPTPPLLAEIFPGTAPDLTAPPWTGTAALFVKPRSGMGGHGTMVVRPLGGGHFTVSDGPPVSTAGLAIRLAAHARRGSLLVQPFLPPPPELADLSPHAPVGLRINTVRGQDGVWREFSSYLRIQPPGIYATNSHGGALTVPFEAEGDRLLDGMLFVPGFARHAMVPWNGARVLGRPVPAVVAARSIAVRGSQAFPGLPAIGWDLLLTPEGPVVLEANWGLSWFGVHLRHLLTGEPSGLPALVPGWIDRAGARARLRRRACPA